MPFYIVHAGTALQKVSVAGALTNITLPAGVTIVDTRPCRFAILAGSIVVVNAPSVNIAVNPATLATRALSIPGPVAALTAAASGVGVLDGAYRFKFSYAILSGSTILTESPLSPVAGPLTLVNQQASLSSISASPTSGVNTRIIYMTTNKGVDYYEAARIADNVTTVATINTSDYDLGLLPVAENKGNPPGVDGTDRFRLIAVWKDRLFASPALNPDDVHYSGNREIYSWGSADRFTVKPAGEDDIGVTAFMARRNEFVMAKRRKLWKLIGDTPTEFEQILIADDAGAVSQDAALVVKDTCYFLGEDGFYEYGNSGFRSLSREDVHPWFTTDDYFNRALFASSFAKYNKRDDAIEVHLAAAGSSVVDRWVSFHRKEQRWFGPHKTDAFTPTAAGSMDDTNGFSTPVVGSSAGFLYRGNQATATDDGTAIDFDVTTKFHGGNTPDIEKLWLELSVLSHVEAAGALVIVPKVGGLDALSQSTISHDLTRGRERLRRLGPGRFVQLRFKHAENNRTVTIFGYEIPFHELGRR